MLEWIVSSSVLIAVVILLRFALRGRISLRLQYALWLPVLVRLLVPVSFGSSALSVENLTRRAAGTEAALIVSALSEIELPRMSYGAAYDEVAEEYAERGVSIAEMPFEQFSESVYYEILNKMRGELSAADIVRILWIGGAAVTGAVFLLSNLCLHRRLKRSRRPLSDGGVPPVYLSGAVETPCLFGLLRPAIYLTGEAVEDAQTRHHAQEHERTHFLHRDHIWAALRGVCIAVHWYNPLVWCAAALSRRDAELACDESVILRLGEGERAPYGRTLIRLSCEKRPALLNTATTMTGSGRGIRERIALLVKKPRTALTTALAAALIAAAAVGCTFTGAEDTDTPWGWAQGLDAGDISSAVLWRGDGSETELSGEELAELLTLFHALEKGDFTENSRLSGGTPAFGLTIRTPEAKYYINEADAPAGALELVCGDGQWWIGDEELAAFIGALRDAAEPELTIAAETDGDIPQAVLSYAADYVRRQIEYYDMLGGSPPDGLGEYSITAAKITKLEQISTGTASLNGGVDLYRLEYRLLPDRPENVVLAGGMSMENGWITEWGSTGQPYLLLHYDDSGSGLVWTPICVTNTDFIEMNCATPEMLEEYGNPYTAAAMELYGIYRAQQA